MDIDSEITKVVSLLPKVSYIDAQIALKDIYETHFGIFNHLEDTLEKNKRPLASVALHDCEVNGEGTGIYSLIDHYLENDIYKFTGLNLLEFINLPKEIVTKVTKTVTALKTKNIQSEQQIINSLNSQTGTKK